MSAFYTEMATVALELITEFGRSATAVKELAEAEDAAKPWRGTDDADNIETPIIAAFVEDEDQSESGTLVRRNFATVWVAVVEGVSLKDYSYIKDGEDYLKIEDVEEVKPGPTVVAYKMSVKR